jgi:iron complex outermembrane receptor protein
MNTKIFKSAFYLSTALGAVGLVPPAHAADDQTSVEQIEQVVVTATRRVERLQDVPISISVFNQQQLNNNNITSAADLGTYVPSLTADTRFGNSASTFAIRGFTQELRTTPSVGVYFADVVAPRGGGTVLPSGDGAGPGTLFDLQNVQVLKGPQGTLFGRNTTGGAVLLVPVKPGPDFGGYLEGSYGNYDMKRIQGVVNIPLNDKMRLRLGVDHETRDGYLKNVGVGPGHMGNVDYTAARAGFDVDITPDLENYTIATFSNSDDYGAGQQLFKLNTSQALSFALAPEYAALQACGFYCTANSVADTRSFAQQWQVINTTTWHESDKLTVKNIASYGQVKSILRGTALGDYIDLSNFNALLAIFGAPGFAPHSILTLANTNPGPGYNTSDQSTFTEELQFQGNGLDNKLIWQGGLYMELSDPIEPVGATSGNRAYCSDLNHFDASGNYDPQCADPLSLGGPNSAGGVEQIISKIAYHDYAAYAQASYDITDAFRVTGGIRYTYDHTKGSATQTVYYGFPAFTAGSAAAKGCALGIADANCVVGGTQNSKAPTWLLEMQYTPAENRMFYAKWSRGYRQGSVNPDAPPQFNAFKQEKVDSYEVGAKTSWDGMIPGVFDVAAFYNDLSNQQLQVGFGPLPGAPGLANAESAAAAIVNGKKSRSWGFEVNATVSPIKDLRFDASYSYLNTKLQSFDLNGAAALAGADGYQIIPSAAAGYQLPDTPENKATLTATYTLPVPESWGNVSFATTYVYTGSMLTAVSPPTSVTLPPPTGTVSLGTPYGRLPPFSLLNMNLNWLSVAGSPFDASLFVTNVTDKHYWTFVQGIYETPYGYEPRTIGMPRMYGIRLRYNF